MVMTDKCRLNQASKDGELLELIRNHDDQAFVLLYHKYWQPLSRFAAQYLKDQDTCAELVQELFVHLHDRHAFWKVRSSVASYLYTALRNRITNYVRNRSVYKKHVLLSLRGRARTHNNVELFINLAELQQAIAQSLKQMPARYREVYILHHQNHFTIKKIALILNRPVDTVEKQLRKATTLLRNHLKDNKMDKQC